MKPFILSFLQKMVIGPGGQLITRITQEAENDLMKIFLRNVRLKISAKLQKWGSRFRWRRSEPDAYRGIRTHEKGFKSEEMDLNWKSVIFWVIMWGWSRQNPFISLNWNSSWSKPHYMVSLIISDTISIAKL